MTGGRDHELDIRVTIPATMDRNNELEFLVAASDLAIRGLMTER